jgi:hypothetical protein
MALGVQMQRQAHLLGGTELFSRRCLRVLVIELRKCLLKLVGDLAGAFLTHERPLIHTGTVFRRRSPLAGIGEQLGPVGERTTLQRFDRMDGAAAGEKKWTLFMVLLAKAQQWRSAAEITPLEFRAGDVEVLGEALDVVARHVHKTLLLTAANASELSLKTHEVRVYREIRKFSQPAPPGLNQIRVEFVFIF